MDTRTRGVAEHPR